MSHTFQATNKKVLGVLSISAETKKLEWTPVSGDRAPINVNLANVTNLQATPENSAKIMLKIVAGDDPSTFAFSNRGTMIECRDVLQGLVSRARREASNPPPSATGDGSSTPATATPPPKKEEKKVAMDDKSLLADFQLQQTLLKESKELGKVFAATVIHGGLKPEEFWSIRVHLLRAFALTSNQKKGPYNVLSTIKPTTGSDNTVNVQLTPEKVKDMFDQYPVVQTAYDDNVPRLKESDFWARFFQSRLFKKLRGERITHKDPTDPLMDRYLDDEYDKEAALAAGMPDKVHRFVDIGGNDSQAGSESFGNRPDMTMRAGSSGRDVVSVIKSINRLSERLAQKSEAPLAEKEYGTLALADLQGETGAEYVPLQVRQSDTNGNKKDSDGDVDMTPLDAEACKEYVHSQYDNPVSLASLVHDDYSADYAQAWGNVQGAVNQQKGSWETVQESLMDPKVLNDLLVVHTTTIEFLRHFWHNFQEGSAECSSMANSLAKCIKRIDAAVGEVKDEQQHKLAVGAMASVKTSIHHALKEYDIALRG
ncbi:YALI0B12452p [Yarrowia lipolytica CLIB122]|uniref:YALI0B12452p n=2 Tax=Yarrowia lipolytica TaxID=4952 RepID=Q6CEW1_YARLI|nr:YALI0B12452p [Yarrowia lipolytica CLIB122]KAJ8052413.1 hypothetical protein LXG23DRAFT_24528 [Yarrowia lipolytica]QNP97183.1 General transcription and DNA repair factor IIH subunit TFB1 [Yarrowia lipolytica]CAG83052.1 YALI0B12452p [Yarrowia lipolytica CLIB122]SEI30949.1 YALIA101S01e11386g1_1 [Yarrowia lipolytica]VBB85618.1 Subunit of TFIIH and nucleotide excision repair factor 3 complexes, putative [Yarrowia lipolytica]|eukprot:XP_500801.1 YALI0B12452p [Yarrowia lipolytica CLIB122]